MPYAQRFCACGSPVSKVAAQCKPCWVKMRQEGATRSRFCSCGNRKSPASKQCKICYAETFKNSPEVRASKAALQRASKWAAVGLTPEEYRQLEEQQAGRCKICMEVKPLVVDHDHGTGLWRGLICQDCNLALGFAKDNPAVLRAAAEYLEVAALPMPVM